MKRFLSFLLCLVMVISLVVSSTGFSSIKIKGIKVDKTSISLVVGKTYNLKTTFVPANTTQKMLKYSTSNQNVAKVDAKGKITAVKEGKVVITITSTSNSAVSAKCNVTVTQRQKALSEYTDNVSYEIWYFMSNCISTNPSETAMSKYLEDKYKIDISSKSQWFTDGTLFMQKMNLAIASQQLPDAVQLTSDLKFYVYQAADAGLLLEIPRNLDKYAPNMKANYLTSESLAAISNPTDGKIYAVPNGTYKLPVPNSVKENLAARFWTAREDIFKKYKLKYPTTPDELYTVLKTIHEKMPTVNGQPFYPYANSYGAECVDGAIGSLSYSFGVMNKYYNMNVDAKVGRVLTYYESPEFLNYLKFMAKLYRENLVAKDFMSVKPEEAKQRIRDGRVGLYFANKGEIDVDVSELQKTSPTAKLSPVAPIKVKGLSDENTKLNSADPLGWGYLCINKNIKQPDRFLKLLDWSVGDGYKYFYYGPPDKQNGYWYIDETGKSVGIEGKIGPTEDWGDYIPNKLGGYVFPMIAPYVASTNDFFDVGVKVALSSDIVQKTNTLYKSTITMDSFYAYYQRIASGPVAVAKAGSVGKIFNDTSARIIMTAKTDAEVDKMYVKMMAEVKKAGLFEIAKEDYQLKYLKAKKASGK